MFSVSTKNVRCILPRKDSKFTIISKAFVPFSFCPKLSQIAESVFKKKKNLPLFFKNNRL